ncbi:MAG: MAPEG family protein [Mangrovicoccus sp.]
MELFEAYAHALVALALYALMGQGLSVFVGITRSGAGLGPGAMPAPDYSNRVYRICRSYHNTVDNAGTLAAAIAAAILLGAAPFWVNLFASLAVAARLAFVLIYVWGVGAEDNGPRSFLYIFNSLMTILIALMAVISGFAA